MHLRTQYKVNAVMTTQLLSLLLLMSGNVEENPGPVGDGECVVMGVDDTVEDSVVI